MTGAAGRRRERHTHTHIHRKRERRTAISLPSRLKARMYKSVDVLVRRLQILITHGPRPLTVLVHQQFITRHKKYKKKKRAAVRTNSCAAAQNKSAGAPSLGATCCTYQCCLNKDPQWVNDPSPGQTAARTQAHPTRERDGNWNGMKGGEVEGWEGRAGDGGRRGEAGRKREPKTNKSGGETENRDGLE